MSCVGTRIGRRVGDLRRAFRGVCTDGVAMCARGCTLENGASHINEYD